MDAVPVRIRLQEGPVNRHPTAAQQGQLTAQQNELPVGRTQRSRIVLAKVSNCLVARGGPLAQPDHFQVAMRLGFQPARTSYPVLITVQVQFQQQSRIVRRMASAAILFRMPESQRLQIQRADERIDRPHRIMFGHVVVHAGR